MGVWAKSLRIFNSFGANATQSIRQVAQQTGLSKRSVHRLKQARARRDHHPESWWGETDAGRWWCLRLVVATLSPFGLQRGVGAETIRAFVGRLHRETQVGCAPSALRGVMQALAHVILETAAAWEHEGRAEKEVRPIIGAVDETCLERMMLVCIDWVSGYVLCAEVAEDRSYDTWHALVAARLEALGAGVLSLVSDRAKALITLAEPGLECRSVPEVFPLIHALVKSYALAMCSRLRHARQAVRQAQALLSQFQASHRSGAEVQPVQALVEASEAEVTHWESVHSAYRHHLETVSVLVHPWRLVDSRRQTSAEVERQVHAETQAIEAFITTSGLPVTQKALDKVRTQLAGVSALVDLWWQRVGHEVQHHVDLTSAWRQWMAEVLLPRMYGQEQRSRTRCPRRKTKLCEAWEAVQMACERHPITGQLAPAVRRGWETWASEHAKAFQRASSAVEGRNGSVSQMPHNHRGVPKGR